MRPDVRIISLVLLVGAGCGDNGGAPAAGADAAVDPDAGAGDAGVEPDAMAQELDLVLHYQFEDLGAVVTDSSDRQLDGTLSDIAAYLADGRVGQALSLSADGTQFVELPTGVLEGVDDFTIAAWVRMDTIGAWARIYDFGNGLADPENRFMYLTPSGANGIHAASYGGSPANESVLLAGTQLPTGVWKHVAITGSGGDRTLYIDGFPATVVTGGPDVPPYEMEPIGGQSWIGKSRFPADPGFGGAIDDFRVYGRVLAPAEIADLAAPQLDYAYWRFDEGSGTTSADSSDHKIATALADGAAWTSDGRLGAALDLKGGPGGAAGPHVVLGTNPLAGCTDELSVSAWVKLRSLDNWARVFDFGTGDTAFIYLTPYDGDGNVRFAMVAPSGIIDVISPAPLFSIDDLWHHVAVTVDATKTISVYVDGAVAATAVSPNVGPADFTAVTDLWIGKSRFPDPYLNGSIDELRIGCRALTADEVKNLAAQ